MKKGVDSELCEKKIISEIKEGNAGAYEELFFLYYGSLCRFAYRFVKSSVESEDLVQEVFIRIWEQRKGLKEDKSIKSYLYIMVKNEALDFIKHQKMVLRKQPDLKESLDFISRAEYEEGLIGDKFKNHVQKTIENLPAKTKQIYKLNKQDGFTYKEIAEILELSEKSIEYHIGKAFQIIRDTFV